MRTLFLLVLLIGRLAIAGEIDPYQNRFGRVKPVVAVIAENHGTELTDFVIPYGVVARSRSAELVAVATQAGPVRMLPALKIDPQATIEEFDARYPDGADYLIVPAVAKSSDPALLAWVAAQGAKGATVVSICDGALVVANSGLFKGRRATGHWATESHRKQRYPDTQWLTNVRYVADGKVVSSAGVSAAMPTALALVEAIAGRERAEEVSRQLGAGDWGTAHDSDIFKPRLGTNLAAYLTGYTNQWFHAVDRLGLPVAAGVDEIALAYTADAWARSKRSRVYAVAADSSALPTMHGLMLLPDGEGVEELRLLPPLPAATPAGEALDESLRAIAGRYGASTAKLVALEFEYIPASAPRARPIALD
ncbi:DJ-1/PfpI family protein [Duganella sp. CF517]|uniref:DJ-1/PfpI family protein n=1 Tax=Duganella sp. CF517 TaxID=1881038 RepID=UPI0008BF495F|nr:DJ-1/PfpI family protein [Duganella sp. CF517]SEN61018.1 DJ-1/PfpI family protein [Duganella sp. CF517]